MGHYEKPRMRSWPDFPRQGTCGGYGEITSPTSSKRPSRSAKALGVESKELIKEQESDD
jgi:hypothetical protein